MNDERWRRVEEICHDALERPGHERAEFIHAACAGDESMRVEVASLLANQSRADALGTGLGIRDVGLGLIGTQLGVYQVVSLLGAGGMGEVYRARDTKLGRDVAIKVLPASFHRRCRSGCPLRARIARAGESQSSTYRSDLRV